MLCDSIVYIVYKKHCIQLYKCNVTRNRGEMTNSKVRTTMQSRDREGGVDGQDTKAVAVTPVFSVRASVPQFLIFSVIVIVAFSFGAFARPFYCWSLSASCRFPRLSSKSQVCHQPHYYCCIFILSSFLLLFVTRDLLHQCTSGK